jgi:hypothetical protein
MDAVEYWHAVDMLAARQRDAGPRSGPVRVGRLGAARRVTRRLDNVGLANCGQTNRNNPAPAPNGTNSDSES